MTSSTNIPNEPNGCNFGSALSLVFENDAKALATALDTLSDSGQQDSVMTLMRLAMLQPNRTTMWYSRLLNRWEDLGQPALKPNAISKKVICLSNHTIDNLLPLARVFGAALGLHFDINVTAYDAVESEVLNPSSELYEDAPDFVAVVLSEHWLNRYIGKDAIITSEALNNAIEMIQRITSSLLTNSSAHILFSSFPPAAQVSPAGYVGTGNRLGRSAALAKINSAIHDLQSDRLTILDMNCAIHSAGGTGAYSAPNYLRAKMPYEQRTLIGIARELAFGIASLCGKSHRALVTDLDNTLWGGIIGDAGRHGIVSSQDDPDGLSYFLLQTYFKSLKSLGILICAASKNSPEIQQIFENNADIAICFDDFSSMQIHWEPKSRSISQISSELGFGAEYMVFVDDNPFELAEALRLHPHLDVVLARTDPTETLACLTESRFFHTLQITDADLNRHGQIAAKQAGTKMQAQFEDYNEYLKAINITVEVQLFGEHNQRRVLQMFQKSNQFNLTTRRHTHADLEALIDAGATIGVFSYKDDFGPQGVIAAVTLIPENDNLRVESWVMSCRVLNRTVEQAICQWIIEQADGCPIVGEFIGTQKNGIVRDLYDRLGFSIESQNDDEDSKRWIFDPAAGTTPPQHLTTLIAA
ncbi:MAG: HAD-IIIC family phosphatase [Planctomycetes bacterium]|nr:HAD-IIIC family phosphatase [Planctomycetota bacterium]